MNQIMHYYFVTFLMFLGIALQSTADDDAGGADALHYWAQWRGPLATGLAPYADPPLKWSESQNSGHMTNRTTKLGEWLSFILASSKNNSTVMTTIYRVVPLVIELSVVT